MTSQGEHHQEPNPARILWLIFGIAFAVRAIYALGVYLAMGPGGLMAEDSALYLQLAHTFVERGDFVRATAEGIRPETERMPLYIIWLAAHRALSGLSDPLFPALTQAALGALACTFVARMARVMDRRLVVIAGLFAALNPTQIVVGEIILSDALFFFFACLALYAAVRWLNEPVWRWALLLGLALALGCATRLMLLPWAAALVVFLPLLALWLRRFRPLVLGHVVAALAICLVVQAPIAARDLSLYGSAQLTSQGGVHLLLWIAPLVLEAADGTPHEEGADIMQARYEAGLTNGESDNPFVRSQQMSAAALDALADLGVGAVAKAWLIGGAINLFSPAGILSPPVSALPRTGFYATPGGSKLEKVWNFLFRNDNALYAWILVLGTIVVVLLRAVQVFGFVRGFAGSFSAPTRDQGRLMRTVLILLLLWTGFILLVNGPVASPKYRLPMEPVGAVCLALAVVNAPRWLKRERVRP